MKYGKLEPYEELIGYLESIVSSENNLSITVSGYVLTISVPSTEADYVSANVSVSDVGRRIAFLATDIPDRPLMVRWPDNPPPGEPSPIWDTLFERAVNGGPF